MMFKTVIALMAVASTLAANETLPFVIEQTTADWGSGSSTDIADSERSISTATSPTGDTTSIDNIVETRRDNETTSTPKPPRGGNRNFIYIIILTVGPLASVLLCVSFIKKQCKRQKYSFENRRESVMLNNPIYKSTTFP
ncbi:hypothetical protein AV955_gp038 [Diadromus pulchellus ascovirus 4a]|uniref:Complete DpAV4 genome n=1 Tax=Diadromus pulchellus ascovirus 4a TaxID=158683 RepID=F2NYW7_9VIRU|nr:hypothetical protein AV955_gp038 [Diadromus pulchellus ascovirus 4a]CCA61395.1 unnamed protein product [Diadromus pulchellus ascovirus 4a]